MRKRFFLGVALLAGFAVMSFAAPQIQPQEQTHKVTLLDGTIMEGEIVAVTAKSISIRDASLGLIAIARENILKIEPPLDEGAGEAATPPPPPTPRYVGEPVAPARGGIKLGFSLGLGALVNPTHVGYNYDVSYGYRGETMTIWDNVANATGFGFGGQVGLFVIPALEITGGFSMMNKTLAGELGMDIPSRYHYNENAQDTTTWDTPLKQSWINFGLNFHPRLAGRFGLYVGGGISIIKATMDLVEDASFQESYVNYHNHQVSITDVDVDNTEFSKTGFFIAGGATYRLTSMFAVVLDVKYILGAKVTDVEHPLYNVVDDKGWDFELGGVQGFFGVKVFFGGQRN